MGNDTDIVDAIFGVEYDSDNTAKLRSNQDNWIREFPVSRINSVEDAADYIVGLDHIGWSEYMKRLRDKVDRDTPGRKKPHSNQLSTFPFSIIRSARGQPSNCVGRMASVYILNKRLELGAEIRIVVEKSRENGGRGEHLSYYMNSSKGKKFLSLRDPNNSAEDLPVIMLPSVYALQKAVGFSSISEYCANKRELEKKAVRYARRAREFNIENSSYVNSLVEKIMEDARRERVI